MSWPASILSALLTGLLGMFVSGYIAALAVDWYNVSSREGASGYFIVLLGLLGFGAGLVIGLIVARTVAAGAHPGFFRALGISLGSVAGLGLLSGGLTRALADVPPEIDGEPLLLAVEVRWPPSRIEAPAAVGPDEASLSLHSIPHFSRTVRASEAGPLWMEDVHLVDGRWVIPGAVTIFTSRGSRMLSVNTGDGNTQGFEVPLPAFPGKRNLEWSEWLPKFRPGVQAPADLLSYRFRVVRMSQPVRAETVGPFQVLTSSAGFYPDQKDHRTRYAAAASFSFRYRGEPLPIEGGIGSTDSTERFDRIDDVALVSGPRPAFLIHADSPSGSGYFFLVSEDGERARIEYLTEGSSGIKGQLLTADAVLFREAGKEEAIRGRIDRSSYQHPGLYLIGTAVVDTRRLSVRRFTPDDSVYGIPSVPPLGLSPDERSFARYGADHGTEPPPLLVVTDAVGDRTYTLPVDPVRMRYATFESLDPAWLDHHFEWRRGPDGVDRLVERSHFIPLPWHGVISVESDSSSVYRLDKGTEALRGALLDFLVSEFKAERVPADSGSYEMPVKIAGHTVNVAFSSDGGYVAVSMARGDSGASALVATIGQQFVAALATGKYDTLFKPR
jgi:hypothetical protein